MPSSYTTSLRLTLPATGELSGQWGNTINTGITELLDSAVAGTASISTWGGAGVAYTLSSTSGAADEARKMFIVASGSPGEAKNVICPAVSKFYVFRNDTTGGFALTLKTPSGTGISVPAGQYKFLYCDGTNVVEMFNSAGALSLSGNLTLSGGTANGVAYLNGSKVVTTGSGLVFDGTNFSTTGTATATKLIPTGGAATGNGMYLPAANTLGFSTNGTQAMTLDASGRLLVGNVGGLGQTQRVQAEGDYLSYGDNKGLRLLNSATTGGGLISANTGAGGGIQISADAGPMLLSAGGSERARIDSAGNLGLRVTPSAWASSYRAAQVGDQSALVGFNGNFTWLGTNWVSSAGGDNYIANGYATIYRQNDGAHAWYTAPSGTAGNAISFTQAMTLDASGNLLVGTTTSPGSPNAQIVAAGTTDPGIQLASTSNGGGLILGAGGGGIGLYTYTGAIGSESYSERARIDTSGNLGIGTSSPTVITAGSRVLEVSGAGDYFPSINLARTGASGYTNVNWKQFLSSDGGLYFRQNSTDRMVLDSSGNLGLGVTPSAWGSNRIAVQVVGASLAGVVGSNALAEFSANRFINSSGQDIYVSSTAASVYQQATGEHRWYTAPSGTAGNAISFTQAMTLDASGRLGVGATSPTAQLVVQGTGASGWLAGARNVVQLYNTNTTAANVSNGIIFGDASNSTRWAIYNDLAANGSEANVLAFVNLGTERARITSGGDLLVGTGTVLGAGGITLYNNGSAGFSFVNNNNAAATGYVFSSYRRSSVEIGSITQNGTTAVLFNTTSDRRLKDNIVPAPSASDVIDAIEIVSHDWKAAPDEHVTYGVIAQDLALVAPQAVLQGDDSDEIEKTWGVDYSKLVPMLIKEIQSLRARVAALEAQP